jgi:4-nitrophenyl phosphatase
MTDHLLLERVRALLIDLDGVLYRGTTALVGAADFIAFLRARGIAFRLITNNATLTPDQYVAKLGGMGIPVGRDELFTSALATALYLQRQGAAGESAFVVGEDGLRDALTAVGIRLDGHNPQWVVVGLDRGLTYEKLATASLAVAQGAHFVGSNPDRSFPTEAGLVPGAGALLAVVTATTGVSPTVIGKPQPLMFELAMEALGVTPGETVMLGDRLDTDIEGAAGVGLQSIMVLTGVSTRADLDGSIVQPSLVVDDLPALIAAWTAALGG